MRIGARPEPGLQHQLPVFHREPDGRRRRPTALPSFWQRARRASARPRMATCNLGLTPAASLAVEFSDYGNVRSTIRPIGGGLYNSNLVAAITNGNTKVVGSSAFQLRLARAAWTSCVGTQTAGNSCMNNGDVWICRHLLRRGQVDGHGRGRRRCRCSRSSAATRMALAGTFYAGFSGSTGGFQRQRQPPGLDLHRWHRCA